MADDTEDTEAKAVTGRPNDIPIDDPQDAPLGGNSTFAERAKARNAKQVDEGENKAVTSAQSKRATKKKAG